MDIKRITTLFASHDGRDLAKVKSLAKYKATILFLSSMSLDRVDVSVDGFGSLDARINHGSGSYCLAGDYNGWIVIDLNRSRCILESSDASSITRRFSRYLERKRK